MDFYNAKLLRILLLNHIDKLIVNREENKWCNISLIDIYIYIWSKKLGKNNKFPNFFTKKVLKKLFTKTSKQLNLIGCGG